GPPEQGVPGGLARYVHSDSCQKLGIACVGGKQLTFLFMSARKELDATVVNIELTLASIIQGVALYFLTENARASLSWQHWFAVLYVAAGLCIIFIFWSRSVIHTLTLIKWRLQFGHNFFYIACV